MEPSEAVAGSSPLAGLIFRVATDADRCQIPGLRRDGYRQVWPDVRDQDLIDEYDLGAHHLVGISSENERVVSSVRILPSSLRPFDTERHVNLGRLLGDAESPAEIGRLSVRNDWRRVQLPFVNAGMLALTIRFARKENISHLVLSALPTLRSLYRIGFFQVTDISYPHPTWGTVHVMYLNIRTLHERLKDSPLPFARLLMSNDLANIAL